MPAQFRLQSFNQLNKSKVQEYLAEFPNFVLHDYHGVHDNIYVNSMDTLVLKYVPPPHPGGMSVLNEMLEFARTMGYLKADEVQLITDANGHVIVRCWWD